MNASLLEFRFGGITRLFGVVGMQRLAAAHVCVVGIGGVGSWVVEALARSGVGALTLVDLDDVCESNINRQLHALDSTIGHSKTEVMAQRVALINPQCKAQQYPMFYTQKTADVVLGQGFDCVVDAIDSVNNKAHLIAQCRQRQIPLIVVGGAGGRVDATAVKVADLSRSQGDALLKQTRKVLRQDYGFAAGGGKDTKNKKGKKWNIDCVYSDEAVRYPWSTGEVCDRPEKSENLRLDCASGFGSASFVTGTFAFFAAGLAVQRIVDG